jgi:oxygen-independent coproporphyrinogen-3 oxidase
VSNYARSGTNRNACRHNLKYWDRIPYLGLGPSAHSFQGNRRWWNHRSVSQYCRDLDRGRRPIQGSERLSGEQASLERLSLRLRTRGGISIKELEDYEDSERVLPELLRAGYLEVIDERAVPTREGFLVADRLPLLFL